MHSTIQPRLQIGQHVVPADGYPVLTVVDFGELPGWIVVAVEQDGEIVISEWPAAAFRPVQTH